MSTCLLVTIKAEVSKHALINTRAEAISALDDKPIPGLYVAGEASAGVFGVTRLTACSLPDCAAFGMIAGEEIAKRARNIKA